MPFTYPRCLTRRALGCLLGAAALTAPLATIAQQNGASHNPQGLAAANKPTLIKPSQDEKNPYPKILMRTTLGDIVLELNTPRAPQTVDNFVQYVRDGHYEGTIFHRVIDGFMIQGGGFTQDMQQKPTRDPIMLESRNGLLNEPYTIAMARTANPHSATSQFFINVADNRMLNAPKPDGYGYTVFGKVTSGQDVVQRIRTTPTSNRGMHQNVPVTPIIILGMEEIHPGPTSAPARKK